MAFAAPPQQRTDQTEMSRLEASGTGSDEESRRSQANEILSLEEHRPTGEAESNDVV